MFYFNNELELDIATLEKMIQHFNVNVAPALRKRKNYYDGKQKILTKHYSDASKPCNKVVTNYCKNIADSYCGYLASPGFISYKSDTNIEEIMGILRYNDYQTEDADFLLDALIYGTACELMFLDNAGKVRFRTINPTTCFGIYDDTLTGDLTHFVRMYKASEWDDSDNYLVDVYSDTTVKRYRMAGMGGSLTFMGEIPHYFNQCPANVFTLFDGNSVFDCIISLQDASNELLSDEIDDYSAFCDAYLALTGCEIDPTDVATMKENRVLELPEGASATWVTKNATGAQVEDILKRLHESVYRIAQCPDFSSETFVGGVTSGVAIRYRLCGMENRAAKIAASMKKALQRRIEIICGIASLKLGEEVFNDIEIDFKRNIPEDANTVLSTVSALKGFVSDATLLAQIPFISDVNAELKAMKDQKKKNVETFGLPPAPQSEEDTKE